MTILGKKSRIQKQTWCGDSQEKFKVTNAFLRGNSWYFIKDFFELFWVKDKDFFNTSRL